MKLGCVFTAGTFYLSPLMLWAAQMPLATGRPAVAGLETPQCEGPISTLDRGCNKEDDYTGPRDDDFHVKGYTFSEPFHLIVSYDWLILQGPTRPVFEGDRLVLRCQAWQDWPLTQVTFYRDGLALGPPGPDRELSIAVVQASDSGHYHCSGVFESPGPGSPEKASAVAITVQELFPAPELRATPSAEPLERSPVTLSCQTKVSPQRSTARLLFSFYKDSRVIHSQALTPEFQIPMALGAHSGSYWCRVATEDSHIWKQSPTLEMRVRGPASSAAHPASNPALLTEATPETSTEPPGPVPPVSTSSSADTDIPPLLKVPDPHLHHLVGALLKQMQEVGALLGHLVVEMRNLSGLLQSAATRSPAREK